MRIDKRVRGAVPVLTPHGPLTADEVDDFRRALSDASAQHAVPLVLDMSQVPYLDSAGIEALLELCGEVPALSRPRLAGLSEACREALDLTDVLGSLSVFDGVENAVRSVRR